MTAANRFRYLYILDYNCRWQLLAGKLMVTYQLITDYKLAAVGLIQFILNPKNPIKFCVAKSKNREFLCTVPVHLFYLFILYTFLTCVYFFSSLDTFTSF